MVLRQAYLLEVHTHTILLRPLQKLRLEVHLFVGHLVDVNELRQYAFLHETHTSIVATVKVDSSDKCLKGITPHIAIVRRGVVGGLDELYQSHFLSQSSQRLTLYELRAGIGEESLALALEMAIDDVAHHSIKNGITKKLQPFIIERPAFLVAARSTLVHQRQLIILQMMRIESDEFVKRFAQFLLVEKRKAQSVDNVFEIH